MRNFTQIIAGAAMLFALSATAQTQVELHIRHKLGANNFAFNTAAQNNLGNNFNVNRLEYYVSGISIKHDGGLITDVPDHYILVNASTDVVEPLGSFNITTVEAVIFHIGVDTPANHSDPSLRAASHPLSIKVPSMHWGWASGYRFVAIEGKAGSSLDQLFEIHALGDQHYMETTVSATAVMKNGKLIIPLNADYIHVLKDIDVSNGLFLHGDGFEEAKSLTNFRDHVFSQGAPVSVNEISNDIEVVAYPNPTFDGNVTLRFGVIKGEAIIKVYDIIGRLVTEVTKSSDKNSIDLHLVEKGIFIVKVQTANGENSITKLQVM